MKRFSLIIVILYVLTPMVFSKNKHKPQNNPIGGRWVSECRYLGGNDYVREEIEIHRSRWAKKIDHTHINAHDKNCSDISISVKNEYRYRLLNESQIENIGSELNLRLISTFIIPHTAEVTSSLNRYCSHRFGRYRTNRLTRVNNRSCGDFVKFPRAWERYFDIIKIENNRLFLGNKIDIQDENDRATEFSVYGFSKAN